MPVDLTIIFIKVKPKENGPTSFCIAINDPRKNISRFERNEEACQNVTSSFSPDKLAAGDQIFRIHVRDKDLLESPIATYTCSSRLKPMPLVSFVWCDLLFDWKKNAIKETELSLCCDRTCIFSY